jgi:predicted RNase H-like nuclease
MTTLIVGFDSAWTAHKRGAIVGALIGDDGVCSEIEAPQAASFDDASRIIDQWQAATKPKRTIVMLDQPIVVANDSGQRPVENMVSSSVGRRRGAVQPSSRARAEMFGPDAPVHEFLKRFEVSVNPEVTLGAACVIETYPVLSLIAMNWTLDDEERGKRLPKYNPERQTYSDADFQYVCGKVHDALLEPGFEATRDWLERIMHPARPTTRAERKTNQDGLDACLCLLVGIHVAKGLNCLYVGSGETGYMVVQYSDALFQEISKRQSAAGSLRRCTFPTRLS